MIPFMAAPLNATHPDQVRMTIGEHLDELRGCVIRSLLALVVASIPCIWLAQPLLALIARPATLALQLHDMPATLLALNPVEALMIYVKVVLIAGVILAGPYIVYQIWRFIAVGLYPHERKWAYQLVPFSTALFLTGAAFMYYLALPLSLNFLVGVSAWLPLPPPEPSAFDRVLLQIEAAPASAPATAPAPVAQVLDHDPAAPAPGTVWFNAPQRRLKVQGADGVYSAPLGHDAKNSMVTMHFRIGEYLSFVLVLLLAFGTAFQAPLIVIFLTRTGLVARKTLASHRKVVVLGIVILAGFLAPPDIMSHLLLSCPMVLLFELGLLLSPERAPQRTADASA